MNKTKAIKKVLSLVMILMMVVSTMVIMPLTTSAACTTVTNVTPSGDGSQANPYLVGSHEEWAGLKKLAEGGTLYNTEVYVKITADFNLGHACALDSSSYPSSSNGGSIKWQIDGQGHTIGETNVQLIMGTVGGVTIKNLTVKMNSTNGEAYGAAFIGVICSNTNGSVLIENCVAAGTMNYKRGGTRTAGGFVGNIYSGSPTLTVKNCVNNMTIYNSDSAAQPFGGILGGCENNGVVVIENCVNNGTITAKAGWVGGMLGRYTSATSITINNCINNGKLVNTNTYVGGMVGYTPKTATITVTDCYSTGEVEMPLAGGTNVPVITNEKTLDEVRAMITMPRQDGTALADLTPWGGDLATATAPVLASLVDEDPENDGAANSAENPYLIGTADELAYLNGNAIGYCKLTNNINMGGQAWTGLTAGNHIDGDNYTIYNIFANAYSSGFLKSGTLNAKLSNLHFSALKSAGGSGAGGFAAYASGSASLTLSNVTIDANSVIGTDRTSGNTTGGIIGDDYGQNAGKFTIDRFIMAAQMTNTSSSKTTLGGLFGGFEGANNAANVAVTNTIVEGTVSPIGSGAFAGALVGEGGAAYAWTNVYVLAGVTAAGISSKAFVPSVSNCYSASFAASENFADVIGEINTMGLKDVEVVSTVNGKRATRLKLTDDFGFMAIADASALTYNPHAKLVMVVAKGAVDAETLAAEGELIAVEAYKEGAGQVCAMYTDISVATMNETYTYAFAVEANGTVVSLGTVYDINCFSWASQLADDGKLDNGTEVTANTQEIALYAAMVDYCAKYDLYVAYLDSLNVQ